METTSNDDGDDDDDDDDDADACVSIHLFDNHQVYCVDWFVFDWLIYWLIGFDRRVDCVFDWSI